MKAYGHSRFDKSECKYGCCTTKSGAKKNCRDAVDRQNRKSARQAARIDTNNVTYESTADEQLID